MNTLLPDLVPGQFWVMSLPRGSTRLLLDLAAQLALESPLRVLDGGNCFNVYTVAQALRRHTPRVYAALGRIDVARAFTCYQVTTLLENTPAGPYPTLVLDLLATFYDESVPLGERRRLLHKNVGELRRLSQQGRVLASAYPPPPEARQSAVLYETLVDAADRIWRLELPQPAPVLRLF
jgi:hypothetical protein